MKLPAQWKSFYLRSLDVPRVGRWVLGPYLRFLWRIIAWFGRDRLPRPLDDGRITTYASTIDSLRRQLETMEQRVQQIERELSAARTSVDASSLLVASTLEGLAHRASQQEHALAFQQRTNSAALEGLARRASQQENTMAFQQRMNCAALAVLSNRR